MALQPRNISKSKLKNGTAKSALITTKSTPSKSSKSSGIESGSSNLKTPLDPDEGNDTEPIDYSEEYDLPEPTEEEIEHEIIAALREETIGNHLPSVDLTLVSLSHKQLHT
jgi:hypothetical protein